MKYLSGFALIGIPTLAIAQFRTSPELSRDWTSIEIVLRGGLIVFSLLLIGIAAIVISRASKTWLPRSILQLIGLTLIVCFSTLLVVAGYSKDQVAPGVIAGYLLGSNETKSNQKDD